MDKSLVFKDHKHEPPLGACLKMQILLPMQNLHFLPGNSYALGAAQGEIAQ